jgi:DnaJ-class molecular chaperone
MAQRIRTIETAPCIVCDGRGTTDYNMLVGCETCHGTGIEPTTYECEHCGSDTPIGQSCGCFDNHCQ